MADLALINGVIYTGDAKQPRVEAVAAARRENYRDGKHCGHSQIDWRQKLT